MDRIFVFIYEQKPDLVFFCCIGFILVWTLLMLRFSQNPKTLRILSITFFSAYFAILVTQTVIGREGGIFDVQLMPFNSFVEAKTLPEMYRSFFMNVMLFIPFGALFPFILPFILPEISLKRNVGYSIATAALLSFFIEVLQLLFKLGRCETDDVISNTLGSAIGTLSFILYYTLLRHYRRVSANSNLNSDQKNLLLLCANALFGKECSLESPRFDAILKEASYQAVLPLAESAMRSFSKEGVSAALKLTAKNIYVKQDHVELHNALKSAGVDYVILKGVASARYYPDPLLRTMGDVDFLTDTSNFMKCDIAIRKLGYRSKKEENSNFHLSYARKRGNLVSIIEMHREPNGMPHGNTGATARTLLEGIVDRAVFCEEGCFVPCDFHHGLILLLHTASHLVREGVGLRHLIDWVVFADSFPEDKFRSCFELPLKSIGLWELARVLSAIGEKYLGAKSKVWAQGVDDSIAYALLCDIFNGGNFGFKDVDRYSQIKFIADRTDGKVRPRSAIAQLFCSIDQKAVEYFPFSKSVFLRVFGWICVAADYFRLLLIGKRRLSNFESTVLIAENRKSIYQKLRLFEGE